VEHHSPKWTQSRADLDDVKLSARSTFSNTDTLGSVEYIPAAEIDSLQSSLNSELAEAALQVLDLCCIYPFIRASVANVGPFQRAAA
jgi:hypothetical protein